jgi:xylose dehydrogenase (NAD/NADP)
VPDSLVNWGILSTADIGIRRVIPAIGQSESGRVLAIASRSLGKARDAAERLGISKAYGSYEDLLNTSEIGAVYIPLPNNLHHRFTILAAEKGKHVLCEKPIALDSHETEEMIRACERNGVLLMEAFMYRFHPQISKMTEIVKSGGIGAVKFVRAAFRTELTDLSDIRYKKELGGGALYDVGCYCVNAIRLLTGTEPNKIHAVARFNDQCGVDESLAGILRFPGLELGVFDCAFRSSYLQTLEVIGEAGTLELPAPFLAGDSPVILKHGAGLEKFTFETANSYTLMVEHFNQCILRGTKPSYSPNDSLNNMHVIDSLYRSARE